ncbi:MAG: 6,7-dimethyl-8-ribityllumazine synthase [Flavobacteriales bacterium]|nr:6,7-dimethyl-8-ribityllumazine synthase [Flavobacteriales bacterium]
MATTNNNLPDFNKDSMPDSSNMKIGIVVSKWNNKITDGLYNGAFTTLIESGVLENNIEKIEVPGSFELIFGAKILSRKDIDVIICLGSVIKGETKHFDYVCQAVSNGIKDLNISLDIPVIFGVLTDNTLEQALNRSGGKHGNKGVEAAVTAIKMAHLNQQ